MTKRYGEVISKENEESFNRGEKVGYAHGREVAQAQCQLACAARIELITEYGELWQNFRDNVLLFYKNYPEKETDMRSQAEAILRIGTIGREAAEGLANVIGEDMQDIEEALQNNDLDRVREIIFSIANSMDAKEIEWRIKFKTLSLWPVS